MNHEIVFKAMWLLIALGNVLFFVVRGSYIFELYLYYLIGQPLLPEICFGPVTFQVNIHTLLVTSLAKWDQAKQVQSRVSFCQKAFVTTAILLSSSLFPSPLTLNPQPFDHIQVLRLDLKIILPLLATSTFVFITVAAVSNFSF